MGQFYSTADLKRGALARCGELTDGSSPYDALAIKYMNELHFGVISGSNVFDVDCGLPWVWARAAQPLILTFQPEYTTGAVSLMQGSASGSFTVAPTISCQGQWLALDDGSNPERYKIITHIAGQTSFTLDGPYNGITTTNSNFRVMFIVYTIGSQKDIVSFVSPIRVYKTTFDEDRNYQIYGLDQNSYDRDYPLATIVSGIPTRFKWFVDSTDNINIQVNETMAELTRAEVDFIPTPAELFDSDQSIPLIPRSFRVCLEYGAAAQICLDKNDSRAEQYAKLCVSTLKALVQAAKREQTQVNSKSKGVIFARQEFLRVRERLQLFVRQGYYGAQLWLAGLILLTFL